jgi:hypothetical protein
LGFWGFGEQYVNVYVDILTIRSRIAVFEFIIVLPETVKLPPNEELPVPQD